MNTPLLITPGICSITLKKYSPEQVLRFMIETGLEAVEWWGGEHVPPGDIVQAQEVAKLTCDAGKSTSSYGSYYRVGISENMDFDAVLDSAQALRAPTIRVWAGEQNREDANEVEIQRVLEDALRIAELADKRECSITFEFHGGTLTNSNRNAKWLAEQLKHPNIFFSWQPPHGYTLDHCLAGLKALLPRLSTVHAYHWTIGAYNKNLFNDEERILKWPDDYHMHPLEDGQDRWKHYLQTLATNVRQCPVLLEFVRDHQIEQARVDAVNLIRWIKATKT